MTKKTPIYDRRASDAYIKRLHAKGWTRYSIFIPKELKGKLKAYRDQLLEEYKKLHPEEN